MSLDETMFDTPVQGQLYILCEVSLCFHFIPGVDEFSPLGFMVCLLQIYEVLWSPNVTFRLWLSVWLARHKRLLDLRSYALLW